MTDTRKFNFHVYLFNMFQNRVQKRALGKHIEINFLHLNPKNLKAGRNNAYIPLKNPTALWSTPTILRSRDYTWSSSDRKFWLVQALLCASLNLNIKNILYHILISKQYPASCGSRWKAFVKLGFIKAPFLVLFFSWYTPIILLMLSILVSSLYSKYDLFVAIAQVGFDLKSHLWDTEVG